MDTFNGYCEKKWGTAVCTFTNSPNHSHREVWDHQQSKIDTLTKALEIYREANRFYGEKGNLGINARTAEKRIDELLREKE